MIIDQSLFKHAHIIAPGVRRAVRRRSHFAGSLVHVHRRALLRRLGLTPAACRPAEVFDTIAHALLRARVG